MQGLFSKLTRPGLKQVAEDYVTIREILGRYGSEANRLITCTDTQFDGSLLRQVVSTRQTKFGRHFHACFARWTIHAAHGEGTPVTPFEWCVELAMNFPPFPSSSRMAGKTPFGRGREFLPGCNWRGWVPIEAHVLLP